MSYTGIPKEVMEAVAKNASKSQKSTYIPGMPSSLQGYSSTNPAINTTPINNYGMPSGLPSGPTRETPVNAYGMPSDLQDYLSSKPVVALASNTPPSSTPTRQNVQQMNIDTPAAGEGIVASPETNLPNYQAVEDVGPTIPMWEEMYDRWQENKRAAYSKAIPRRNCKLAPVDE